LTLVLLKVTDPPSIRKFETVGLTLNWLVPAPNARVPAPDIVPAKVLLDPSNSSVPVEIESVPLPILILLKSA
jgi:hypothetical protein